MKNNLDYFHKYVSKKNVETEINNIVWSYTRVSSKEQFDRNDSVERQMEANKEYALKHGFEITESFGGTYESAKSDISRREFQKLIEKVESNKKKPFAILVFKLSRFSRSGGSAIGLVNYLVEDLGVNLIEVSTGNSTVTERGRVTIYTGLTSAHVENLEKKELVIPAMIASLKAGNLMGISPIGYDHYGRRVRNEKFFSFKQRITINKDGEILKEAWQWKSSGLYSDAQIIAKLEARGLHITKQKMSQLWRNPFYCGILVNAMLDEPVKGNWEPLVSHEDFIKVQTILDGNVSGYQHKKGEELRPLTRLIRCNDCKGYLVGYQNNQKNLHYYRCLKCRGVSVNAMTTVKALKKGANDLFVEFLKSYALPGSVASLIKLQLTKIFNEYNAGASKQDAELKERLCYLESKLKSLKVRHGMGDIDKETFDLTTEHLNEQIRNVSLEMNTVLPTISNLNKMLSSSLEKLENISEIWGSSDLENKRRIQKTMFPEGVYYDVKNHQYLTCKVNSFVELVRTMSNGYAENEKRTFDTLDQKSASAPPAGLEPATL